MRYNNIIIISGGMPRTRGRSCVVNCGTGSRLMVVGGTVTDTIIESVAVLLNGNWLIIPARSQRGLRRVATSQESLTL